jgi:hypothetical protein
VAPCANIDPVTVSVKGPTSIGAGVIALICGTGFCSVKLALADFCVSEVSLTAMVIGPVAGGNCGAV